jgi:hypothetical protein
VASEGSGAAAVPDRMGLRTVRVRQCVGHVEDLWLRAEAVGVQDLVEALSGIGVDASVGRG